MKNKRPPAYILYVFLSLFRRTALYGALSVRLFRPHAVRSDARRRLRSDRTAYNGVAIFRERRGRKSLLRGRRTAHNYCLFTTTTYFMYTPGLKPTARRAVYARYATITDQIVHALDSADSPKMQKIRIRTTGAPCACLPPDRESGRLLRSSAQAPGQACGWPALGLAVPAQRSDDAQ